MSWQKVKMGEFLTNRENRFKPSDKNIAGLKRIDKIDFSGNIYLSEKPSNTDMILVKQGDLVISGINVEKGAMSVYQGKEDVTATIHYSSYSFDENKIDIDFLKMFLKSPEFKLALKEQVPGGIKTEIKPKHILPLEVFIPTDISEQKVIVSEYLKFKSKNTDLYNELTYQQDLVKQLRQAILREAMQGKLVKQDIKDGHAKVLLEKIKAEKAKSGKKEKPLPPIKPEEIPFDIPENWVWCRLGEICTKIGSGSTPKGGNYSEKGVPFFRSQNIYDDGLDYDDIKNITDEVHKQMSGTTVIANDILLNITGGSMGRCALVPKDFKEGNVSQHVCIIRPIEINNRFVHSIILSPFFQTFIFSSTTGAGREGLPKYNLEQFIIPLPPLSEQNRIVQKLNELMQYCNELEASIKQSQVQNEKLLQQVLREALRKEPVEA